MYCFLPDAMEQLAMRYSIGQLKLKSKWSESILLHTPKSHGFYEDSHWDVLCEAMGQSQHLLIAQFDAYELKYYLHQCYLDLIGIAAEQVSQFERDYMELIQYKRNWVKQWFSDHGFRIQTNSVIDGPLSHIEDRSLFLCWIDEDHVRYDVRRGSCLWVQCHDRENAAKEWLSTLEASLLGDMHRAFPHRSDDIDRYFRQKQHYF